MNNIVVFGKTKESARKFFDNLIKDIPVRNIEKLIRSDHEYKLQLIDGTLYYAVDASCSMIGRRCSRAYVDRKIDKSYLLSVIYPCIYDETYETREFGYEYISYFG